MPDVTPFLWFDRDAEEAVRCYVDLLPDSRIGNVTRYPEGAPMPAGTALVVEFTLGGRPYIAMNGGPGHPHTDAFSLSVSVDTQEEIDRYWDALTADGGREVACGWLQDRWGLSWQIVPTVLPRLLGDPDPARAGRAMAAMMNQVKFDIAALEAAADGV